jgi:acetoin utilization deacetylase AcuC-like enzyme
MDPGGRQNLTPDCYRRLTATLMAAADRLCSGRLVLLHEGGYSTLAVPYCGLAILEQLTGHSTGVLFNEATDGDPWNRPLHRHERDAVEVAAANLATLQRS